MRIVVLLSTYQGEKFIGEQLASILMQLPAEGKIIVRDDGSTDGTVEQIAALGDRRVRILPGANIGFAKSFFHLMEIVPANAQMVMLCDQDDVWLQGKIERAWQAIRNSGDEPMLYCSRLQLVDPQLGRLGLSPRWTRAPSFANALTENIVTGCTTALNLAAVRLVSSHSDSSHIYFHDWWMYLVVAAFGHVVFDPEPTILYRQHGANVIGMGSGIARYSAILRFLRKTNWVHIMYDQVEYFRAIHGQRLDPQKRRLLDRFFDPHSQAATARLILAPHRFQQSLAGEVLFRLLVIANVASGRGLLSKGMRARGRS